MFLCVTAYMHPGAFKELKFDAEDFQAKKVKVSTADEVKALEPGFESYDLYEITSPASFYSTYCVSIYRFQNNPDFLRNSNYVY